MRHSLKLLLFEQLPVLVHGNVHLCGIFTLCEFNSFVANLNFLYQYKKNALHDRFTTLFRGKFSEIRVTIESPGRSAKVRVVSSRAHALAELAFISKLAIRTLFVT